MAQVGKGDPRWIVTDRTDGANVNNWHWTEKDISQWAKEKFETLVVQNSTTLLEGFSFTVKKYEGDCGLMNRKKKLVYYFQVTIELEYVGEENDNKVTGSLNVHEIDQDEEGWEVQIDGKKPEGNQEVCLKLLKTIKKEGPKVMEKLIENFKLEIKQFMNEGAPLSPSGSSTSDDFSDLQTEEHDVDVILPKDCDKTPQLPASHNIKATIKKTEESQPMGTLLDPDTLELLEVKENTPAIVSEAKFCVGMNVITVNSVPVSNMSELFEAAKGSLDIVLELSDRSYNCDDFHQGTLTGDALLEQTGLSQSLKSAFMCNRGLNRFRKTLGGVKSSIMRSSALQDLRTSCNMVSKSLVCGYARSWALCYAALDDRSLVKEAIASAHGCGSLLNMLFSSLSATDLAAVPFASFLPDSVRPFFLHRVSELAGSSPVSPVFKGAFGKAIRTSFKAHALPAERTVARKVGRLMKE
eukprot:TRINITY_DN1505_c1_g1_i1.p1 TRINITY_DN1505_c1_g1~~TRINITY_DN1505_c1_g1_i1.p1  ORF type:complete len:486 (+),score=95.35 TRINITY_DN1505_c1_g1_i1:57-1460(+)